MPEGALFCAECGLSLIDTPTQQLDIQSGSLDRQTGWGTVTLDEDQDVLLRIGDVAQPIEIRADVDFILGRGDTSGKHAPPDLDLSAYGALEKGVSRVHAALRRGEGVLAVIDLDSTNGTFLNGHRLAAHQPHLVRDGDEIRVGKLPMHVYFTSD
jgi:pSer/pThr/pTyr-binding forkhead associated (FHA) protein